MHIKGQHNLTAILYDKKGKILSIGKNSFVKTHPLQSKYANQAGLSEKIFLHAEIDAIVKCSDLSKAHRILVTRYNKTGQPLLAKPCEICQLALRHIGIKVIDYTVAETNP